MQQGRLLVAFFYTWALIVTTFFLHIGLASCLLVMTFFYTLVLLEMAFFYTWDLLVAFCYIRAFTSHLAFFYTQALIQLPPLLPLS